MQTRRDFLFQFGTGALGLVALPLFEGCVNWSRTNLTPEADDTHLCEKLGKAQLEILQLAALAPSSHNSQPWGIKIIAPDHWQILSDPTRRLPSVDSANREVFLSIGAFLANFRLAAPHFGWQPEIQITAKNTQATQIADCFFSKMTPQAANLENLKRRRTLRAAFSNRELAEPDLAAIKSPLPDQIHYFSRHSKEGQFLARATIEANQTQVRREPAQSELADWIRWSTADAKKFRDGLTPATMEINGFAGWFVRQFYDRDSVLAESFRQKTIQLVSNQVAAGAGWLVVTSADSSVPALLDSGQIYEKICLDACARKIAIHPMSQMLEESPWNSNMAAELGLNAPVQFILRVGYVEKYPAPVSLRRPVAWFVA